MTREVRLSRVRTVLDDLAYPVTAAEARAELDDVTVTYADGREPLADLIDRSALDAFESLEDLESELFGHAPVEALGEPGQSEGDA